MYNYNGLIINVVDGDTFDIEIDLGFDVFTTQRLRLARVNTPEIRGGNKEFGYQVKEYVEDLILFRTVEIETSKKGKYGRYIAEVYCEAQDNIPEGAKQLRINLGTHLVEMGMGEEVDYG